MLSSEFKSLFKQNQNSFGEKYKDYLFTDSIVFFRLVMISFCLNSLMALLVFIIKDSGANIITLMSIVTCIYFLLIFYIHKLKSYTQSALTIFYIFYVASAVFITLFDRNMPFFIGGYGNGIIQCALIQFCNPKLKFFFVFATPWIFLAITNMFFLTQLHYITYALTASSLLGLLTHQFEVKQRLIYTQSVIIKNQQEIIKKQISDNLFAISYNMRDGQFKLEFSNASFKTIYQDDIKQVLRTNQVVPDQGTINSRKNFKTETLEEYLFSCTKVENDENQNFQFSLKIKHIENEQLQDVNVVKTYFHSTVFVISLKSNIAELKLEKHEKNQNNFKKLPFLYYLTLVQYYNLNMLTQINQWRLIAKINNNFVSYNNQIYQELLIA